MAGAAQRQRPRQQLGEHGGRKLLELVEMTGPGRTQTGSVRSTGPETEAGGGR